MLFAVTDVTWQALIAAITTLLLAWMQQRTKGAVDRAAKEAVVAVGQAEAAATSAAVKASEVQTRLAAVAKVTVAKIDQAAEQAACSAAEVKLKLATQVAENTSLTAETLAVAHSIHALGNGEKRLALLDCVRLAERVADLTRHPDDLAAATRAQNALAAHDARQALADEGKHSTPQEPKS